jgi:hypothetical protein
MLEKLVSSKQAKCRISRRQKFDCYPNGISRSSQCKDIHHNPGHLCLIFHQDMWILALVSISLWKGHRLYKYFSLLTLPLPLNCVFQIIITSVGTSPSVGYSHFEEFATRVLTERKFTMDCKPHPTGLARTSPCYTCQTSFFDACHSLLIAPMVHWKTFILH